MDLVVVELPPLGNDGDRRRSANVLPQVA